MMGLKLLHYPLNRCCCPIPNSIPRQLNIGLTEPAFRPQTAVFPINFVSLIGKPDFDFDGFVGISDFFSFVLYFGTVLGDDNYDPKYDLNHDGETNYDDFLIFAQYFGQSLYETG